MNRKFKNFMKNAAKAAKASEDTEILKKAHISGAQGLRGSGDQDIRSSESRGLGGSGAQDNNSQQTEKLEEIILKKFEELGSGKGMKMETLIKDLKDVDENLVITAVQNLMHKGDMFEPRKGTLKLV